jgi:glutathione synthase/RimK-type ligase-like ATP-grasp enzyme
MIDGSPGDFASLGDPNFKSHDAIDPSLGDVWRTITLPYELDPASQQLGACMGYELPQTRATIGQPRQEANDVILVVPPFTYRADAYIAAARRLGLSPVCALDPAYGVPKDVDEYLPVSFEFPGCAAQILVNYAFSRPVAGVLSVDDGGAEIATLACATLGLPHNPRESHTATRDKYAMRLLFQRDGVPSPEFSLHMLCEDPDRIARRLDFPVVLKPLHLTGSRGVIRANDREEFVAAVSRLGALLAEPGTGPDPKRFLVERYIPGAEVSVDGVLQDGVLRPLAIYDKPDPMEGPFFEETIFTTPSRHPLDVQKRILSCAERAARAIGLRMGPVHVELRVNENGPWLLEVAARTMGGYCSRALPFQDGRTLEELVLSQATKRSIDTFSPASGA